jgi:D-xylose transport system substrate-binding protein
MNARILLVLVSCLVSVLTGLVISRGEGGSEGRGKPLIGFSMETLKEERWQMDRDLFVEAVRERGADVLVQAANGDDAVQLTQVRSLLTQGIDVLVIIPRDGEAMAKAVELAHAEDVPVLSYDRLLMNCEPDLYITFDSVKVGEMQGRFVAERVPENGKLRLVRIYGAKTDNNALLFKQGQDNILGPLIEAGRIEVVLEDWAVDWKPENAKRIVNAAITRAGRDGIDAVLASNDGTAGGAIQALLEEGLAGKVLVTGQDAELTACQRIVQGTQSMTVYKPIVSIAGAAAEAAAKMARGRRVSAGGTTFNGKIEVPSVVLDIVEVTKENLRETVIADGFRREEDVFAGGGALE